MLHRSGGEGVIRSVRGELRFAAGGDVRDARGETWSIEGDLDCLRARIEDGLLVAPDYPDALARAWAALTCPTAGDILMSAEPGYEFLDWGGQGHEGGGNPRLAARLGLARRAAVVRHRPRERRRQGRSGRCATSPGSCATTSASRDAPA